MDRREVIRSLFDHSGFGLEIGPSHAPIFPKSGGFNVEILDHGSAEELRAKYATADVDRSAIEEVDYISDGRLMHEVIGQEARYDFIFSSHVIEHVTDFIGYFQSCQRLLKPGGLVVLAVPDKRYTFDNLQVVTTTGQVLQAHVEGRTRHSAATCFDFVANFSNLGEVSSWSHFHTGPILLQDNLQNAKHLFDTAALSEHPYLDVHGWRFTPASFRLIMSDLNELGILALKECQMVEVGALEFYVTLSMDGPGNGLSRMDILKDMQREQALSSLQLLAHQDPVMALALAAIRSAPPVR